MKTIILVLTTLLSASVFAIPTEELKADWIKRNDVASDTPVTIESLKNAKGGEVGAYVYSSWDCGSQGCTYTVYAPVNNNWCAVGTYIGVIDNLTTLNNPSCGDGFIDDAGNKESVEDTPAVGAIPNFNVTLTVEMHYALPIKVVSIESLEDSLVVNNVRVNRGNCIVTRNKSASRKIGYAETSLWPYSCLTTTPREIAVTVNGVEYLFTAGE